MKPKKNYFVSFFVMFHFSSKLHSGKKMGKFLKTKSMAFINKEPIIFH